MGASPIRRWTPSRTNAEVNPGPVPRHACEQAVCEWLQSQPFTVRAADQAPGAPTLAVAFSGGADSTALLLATQASWPGGLVALHVHHGLQAAADDFESHARSTCETLGVELRVMRAAVQIAPGQSPEDAARTARYTCLAEMALRSGAACVLLAQHADDQAETLMLALSRGAGLPGLASMAPRFERHQMLFARPLLQLSGASLREYVGQRGVGFVEDPSNADQRFTRNRIRAVLMPAWERCFPGVRQRLIRSAGHAAQAQRLLEDLARIDLNTTGVPPRLQALQALSRDRQTNVLRHWLQVHAGASASEAQMSELLDQVAACRTRGHRIQIKVGLGFVQRRDDCLAYTANL